ncbi:LacI family DNA-binding transcriptional regulator [Roseinatronobacter alkalisoli]|uniref:LacI family DNA-binding transcriptional regulator n=1 Tax=Roseinatronobacter alkalisoli TaxID=3028235 RepID=A0ABT5TEP6_9RHOB|nr:LacI family DNA-binding transcriptional regulator [Roseinatronobacter sp. HJB301]MDD7973597.1 LacI family DNA-binding transcriptional regulator [Roseinatronobacter sp. HJB301]
MRPTLKDVARHSGLSIATIDRVVNQRPGVRQKTVERVQSAMATLGYIRDVTAADLARREVYRFVFVIHDGPNSFMQQLAVEIETLRQFSANNRLEIDLYRVPPFDGAALARLLNRLDPATCSGVAVIAADGVAVRDALVRLKALGLPVVTLVSDVPAFPRDAYVGIDNVAAGRTAGRLMGRFLGGRNGKIALVAGSMLVRDHVERRMGFEQVIAETRGLDCLPVLESRDDSRIVQRMLRDCLSSHPDIVGIYNMGAGNRGLIETLSAVPPTERPQVIVHELSEHSRHALSEGIVDAIIHQDAGHEVRSALRVLKAKIDKIPLLQGQEQIRIEIYLNENLPAAPA